MTLLEAIAIFAAGTMAGAINTLVGSGTLITFPILITLGFAPVTSNVSNSLGLVPGAAAGAFSYRREISHQRDRASRLVLASALGGATGAVALIVLPSSTFKTVVPGFIAAAVLLVLLGPRINRAVAARRGEAVGPRSVGVGLWVAIYLTGVYGGYFGAAQGIMLIAVLGLGLADDLHRINALKIMLAGIVNLVAAFVFIPTAPINWSIVAVLAVGSTIGGGLGGRYGRSLSPTALRILVVVVGVIGMVRLIAG